MAPSKNSLYNRVGRQVESCARRLTMPIHDWSTVIPVFHHFHHAWIAEIARDLNGRAFLGDHYAMIEQRQIGVGNETHSHAHGVIVPGPDSRLAGETDLGFYLASKTSWRCVT